MGRSVKIKSLEESCGDVTARKYAVHPSAFKLHTSYFCGFCLKYGVPDAKILRKPVRSVVTQ